MVYYFGYDLYGSKNMATTTQRTGGEKEMYCFKALRLYLKLNKII